MHRLDHYGKANSGTTVAWMFVTVTFGCILILTGIKARTLTLICVVELSYNRHFNACVEHVLYFCLCSVSRNLVQYDSEFIFILS